MLPQQLRYRGVLVEVSHLHRRAAVLVLQRGVGLGVEQRLHDRCVPLVSSGHQGGDAMEVMQVDARAACQQHPHHRSLPSVGGRKQQRRALMLCAALVHAAAFVQPRSHGLQVALLRRYTQNLQLHRVPTSGV